jgi:hypothetical protein
MQEALGLRPVTARRGGTALDEREVKELLKRGEGVDGLGDVGEDGAVEARVKGLGYSKLAADAAPARPKAGEDWGAREVLGGLAEPYAAGAAVAAPAADARRAQRHDSASSSSSEGEGERRAAKRARKAARAEKRVRKEAKRRRSRSRSRGGGERERRRSRSRERAQRRDRSRSRDNSRRRHI